MLRMPNSRFSNLFSSAGARSLPSWRTVGTVAAIVVTAILFLELGIWALIALFALYGALDLAQRAELRRDARNRLMIRSAIGQVARCVAYLGPARYCNRAAWVAKRLGWIVCPMVRATLWRHSVRFRAAPGAAPLSSLLQALNDEKLATRIDLRGVAPNFARKLAEQGFWQVGRDI